MTAPVSICALGKDAKVIWTCLECHVGCLGSRMSIDGILVIDLDGKQVAIWI